MKEYIVDGKHYLFKEGEQPEGAVEFKKKAEPQTKAVEPANKARETKKK
jgi:hypothetical protein